MEAPDGNRTGDDWISERVRRDGTVLIEAREGEWLISHPLMGLLTTCPCCKKPFATAQAAKRTADAIYAIVPLQGDVRGHSG